MNRIMRAFQAILFSTLVATLLADPLGFSGDAVAQNSEAKIIKTLVKVMEANPKSSAFEPPAAVMTPEITTVTPAPTVTMTENVPAVPSSPRQSGVQGFVERVKKFAPPFMKRGAAVRATRTRRFFGGIQATLKKTAEQIKGAFNIERHPLPKKETQKESASSLSNREETPSFVVDLVTCTNGVLTLDPIVPMARQSWWLALKSIVASGPRPALPLGEGKGPKDQEVSFEKCQTPLCQRMREGTLPYPSLIGMKWDESQKKLATLPYLCPFFNGMGDDHHAFDGIQRLDDGYKVFIPNPRKLFNSKYSVLIEGEVSTGRRIITAIPARIDFFQNTEIQRSGATNPSGHDSRKWFDKADCAGEGQSCRTGRMRMVTCDCKVPQKYYSEDNAALLTSDDPCGLRALTNPNDPYWNSVLTGPDREDVIRLRTVELSSYKSGIIYENANSTCYAIDVPTSDSYVRWMTSGNLDEAVQREDYLQRGPKEDSPTSPPQTPDNLFATGENQKCASEGRPFSDPFTLRLNAILAAAQYVPQSLVSFPQDKQVNYTYFPSNRHKLELFHKGGAADVSALASLIGYNELSWQDYLGHDSSFSSVIESIEVDLLSALSSGAYPNQKEKPPAQGAYKAGRIALQPTYHPLMLGVLSYLDQAAQELKQGKVKIAFASLNTLTSGLSYYDARSRTILIERAIEPRIVRRYAQNHDADPGSMDRYSYETYEDFEGVLVPFLQALFLHVQFVNDLKIQINTDFNGVSPTIPQLSLLGETSFPAMTPPAQTGNAPPLLFPDIPKNAECKGLYFSIDGQFCWTASGYVDSQTCEQVPNGPGNIEQILQKESFFRFASLVALHHLKSVKDLSLRLECSLGDNVAGCGQQCFNKTNGTRCRPYYYKDDPTTNESLRQLCPDPGQISQESWECRPLPCVNAACETLRNKGTCFEMPGVPMSQGFVAELTCGAGAGALVGERIGESFQETRPENYFLPEQQIRNLTFLGKYSEALGLASATLDIGSLLPGTKRPDIVKTEGAQ